MAWNDDKEPESTPPAPDSVERITYDAVCTCDNAGAEFPHRPWCATEHQHPGPDCSGLCEPAPAKGQFIAPVDLPDAIEGAPLSWQPWDLAPVMSHIPYDCEHCGFDREPAVAVATSPEQRGRWTAVRCRQCQATTVTTFRPDVGRLGRYVRVWSAPPQPWSTR